MKTFLLEMGLTLGFKAWLARMVAPGCAQLLQCSNAAMQHCIGLRG
jgi:hypothetical protein